MQTHVHLRDIGFLSLGAIAMLLVGGMAIANLHREHLKNSVRIWLDNNRDELSMIQDRTNSKLHTNTAIPGSIWVTFIDSYTDHQLQQVATWLAHKRCPYGISQITPEPTGLDAQLGTEPDAASRRQLP